MKQEQPKKQIQEKLKTVPREIPAWAEGFLTKDVLSQIETAVKAGEQKTSGEIVPVLVRASSSEHSARRVLALILVSALLVLVPLLGLNDYNWFNFLGELLGLLLGLVGIYWLPMPASFLRFLVPTREQILRVDHRAELEFYRSRIQQTSGHTGILLFVSLAERRAVVLADKGISEKLPQETWDVVLKILLDGFKKQDVGGGFSLAIARCAEILGEHFPLQTSDRDELANRLVIRE